MRISEEERFKKYTLNSFYGNPSDESDIERHPYHQMKLKEPMFAALCYAYGYPDYQSVVRAFEKPADTFKEQLINIKENQTRTPHLVLDIGAGRGELTATLLSDGVPCYAIDPAVGSAEIMPTTFNKWLGTSSSRHFLNEPLIDALDTLKNFVVDTIIFCESIEHILKEEFDEALPIIEKMLTETHGYLIITNWVGFHPIHPDGGGWDHIREIDDALYNTLCGDRNKKIYRKGSHLVLAY